MDWLRKLWLNLEDFLDRHLYTFITLGLFLAALAYSLDSVFKFIGLIRFYMLLGMAAFVISIGLIVFVRRYDTLDKHKRRVYIRGLLLVTAAPIVIFPLVFVPFGWLTAIVLRWWLPITLATVILGVILVIHIIQPFMHWSFFKDRGKKLTIFTLIWGGSYLLGMAVSVKYAEAAILDQLHHENHHYFLYVQYGWTNDPDSLTIYECASAIGLFCEPVYQAPDGNYYRKENLRIIYNPTTDKVSIRIN